MRYAPIAHATDRYFLSVLRNASDGPPICHPPLTAPDYQHPWRRCFVFNDVLIGIIALCAFECAQIVARLGRLDASKHHFRAALCASCLHQAITK